MLISVIRQVLTVGVRASVMIMIIVMIIDIRMHSVLRMTDAVLGVDRRIVILRPVKLKEAYQAGYGDRQESEELLERSQA